MCLTTSRGEQLEKWRIPTVPSIWSLESPNQIFKTGQNIIQVTSCQELRPKS